jgi:hypothetical protein
VASERFGAAELSAAGGFETLGSAAIAFHLRHYNSHVIAVPKKNQK